MRLRATILLIVALALTCKVSGACLPDAVTASQGALASEGGQSTAALAEVAYRAGDYAKAKELWTRMLVERGEDGRLEYDLGNCEYRLGNYARAVWRFERARRALGADERVRFNLALAERKLGLEGADASSFFATLRGRLRRLDRGDWFSYGLAVELFGLILLGFVVRRRVRVLIVLATCLIVIGAASLARAATLDDSRILGVVILEDGTPVRGEPRAELQGLMKLGAGVRATYVADSPGWVRVRVGEREGWVPRPRVGLY